MTDSIDHRHFPSARVELARPPGDFELVYPIDHPYFLTSKRLPTIEEVPGESDFVTETGCTQFSMLVMRTSLLRYYLTSNQVTYDLKACSKSKYTFESY
jgi:hypothetical protein